MSPHLPESEPPPMLGIFSIGEVLSGTYEIRGVLGEGGMGQVFDAHDRGLGRRVAIKANFQETPEHYSIRNEARALAALRHPGVVGVYALGTHNAVDYMVMEHVSGVGLDEHLERLSADTTPLAEKIDVLAAIADGLAAIHRAGLSHGDVKPDNVLLSASGRVVLTDLGLVRPAFDTDAGVVAGTPEYMAPEIATPRYPTAERHLIDVYAFGVLAYHLLAGKLPFNGDTPVAILVAHADEPVPRLDATKFPRRLVELVQQLLAKDPTDRPASMDTVTWQLRVAKEDAAHKASNPALSVLIVDDDKDIARLVGMYVKQAAPNAEIAIAGDAQEALEHFRKKSPRLVFLDLMMPKMSGFELFTYLRGVHLVDASTVVAMSAGGSPTDVGLMLELGAQDFIPKGPELRGRVTKIVSALVRETKA